MADELVASSATARQVVTARMAFLVGFCRPDVALCVARGLLVVPPMPRLPKGQLPFLVLVAALGCMAPATGEGAGGGTDGTTAAGKADRGDEVPASGMELKVTIAEGAITDALDALSLDVGDAERRYVTFYDSADLALFEAGIVLRSRKIIDDDDDSTVKVRPLLADEAWAVAPELFEDEEFKCEIDRTPSAEASSCSLSATQDRGEIDDVRNGERDVSKLFSSRQEGMLALFGPEGFELDEALVLGPVDTLRWKIELDGFAHELTVELWSMPDGGELLELSIKVDAGEADEAMDALLELTRDLDLPLDETQSTKTRRALSFFADAGQP